MLRFPYVSILQLAAVESSISYFLNTMQNCCFPSCNCFVALRLKSQMFLLYLATMDYINTNGYSMWCNMDSFVFAIVWECLSWALFGNFIFRAVIWHFAALDTQYLVDHGCSGKYYLLSLFAKEPIDTLFVS